MTEIVDSMSAYTDASLHVLSNYIVCCFKNITTGAIADIKAAKTAGRYVCTLIVICFRIDV